MASDLDFAQGTLLGGEFRIQKPLSAGGMGAVFVAEQITTGKLRALKLMHRELVADAKLRERFEQEARVGSLIPSDHVVQVIGAGIDQATGAPWLAMELLEGDDLAAHIKAKGALPVAEVRALFEQLCHGLGAAHSVGVVHRDMKPENIFLAQTRSASGPVQVRILDFGIAKVAAEAKTMATAAIGTPLWMAPEQTDPRAPIKPAADVWSLGLIAFTMLTGRVYWRAASDPLAAMTALMREMLFEAITPASQRAAELGVVGSIPEGFDAWFIRCMSRDPSQRFADAKAAMEALGPALDSPPIEIAAAAAASRAATDLATAATNLALMGTGEFLERSAASGVSTTNSAVATTHKSVGPPSSGSPKCAPFVNVEEAPVAEPERRRRFPFGAIAGAAAGALITAGLFAYLMKGGPDRRRASTAQVAESATAAMVATSAPAATEAPPEVTPSGSQSQVGSTPTAPPRASGSPIAASSGRPSAPSGSPQPPKKAPRPFDAGAAQRSLNQIASEAKFTCGQRQGPRGISATVFFNPNGNVQRVMMSPEVLGTQTGLCAQMVLHRASVPPFDGDKLEQMSAAIILP